MLLALFVLAAILIAVCLVRLVTLRDFWDPRPLTLGLSAIAVAFVLYLPAVDHVVDPKIGASPIGWANMTDLAHVLLTLAAWWALGVLSLRVLRLDSPLEERIRRAVSRGRLTRRFSQLLGGDQSLGNAAVRLWGIANLATAIAVLVVWRFSDLPKNEVDDIIQLHDTGTRIVVAMYGAWAFVGGVLVVTASVIGLRYPSSIRRALWVMLSIGACGIGYTVTAGVVVAIGGVDALQSDGHLIMGIWAIPGLILLIISGAAAPLAAARDRLARR